MKVRKQALTLLEIMIVICLIAIIAGVVGYNMKGSLDEGKAQKTILAQDKIADILQLQAAKDSVPLERVVQNPKHYLEKSGLIKDAEDMLKDGWGSSFEISIYHGNIRVKSENLKKFESKKKSFQEPAFSEEDEYEY